LSVPGHRMLPASPCSAACNPSISF
jgi:hypothetical protein